MPLSACTLDRQRNGRARHQAVSKVQGDDGECMRDSIVRVFCGFSVFCSVGVFCGVLVRLGGDGGYLLWAPRLQRLPSLRSRARSRPAWGMFRCEKSADA